MNLADDVRAYYWSHFAELPPLIQFHFASRLAAWEHDRRAIQELQNHKSLLVPSPLNLDTLKDELTRLINQPPHTDMPGFRLREPFFRKYPQLFGWQLALFRVRHLEAVYGIPARHVFLEIVPRTEVEQLIAQLWQDTEALCTLSTPAINFFYLAHRYLLEMPESIDVQRLYDLRNTYNLVHPEEIRLLVYFFTHCIIAASDFYVTALPPQHTATYQAMLNYLEDKIGTYFAHLSLDVKLEFLVCCRIASYKTTLTNQIYTECQQSISPEGAYLIDTVNDFAKLKLKRDLAHSEHRNVLFLMGLSAFRPQMAD